MTQYLLAVHHADGFPLEVRPFDELDVDALLNACAVHWSKGVTSDAQ